MECCNICGGKIAEIRGKYPKWEKRKICPTCSYEKLEQIHDLSSSEYGKTYMHDNTEILKDIDTELKKAKEE